VNRFKSNKTTHRAPLELNKHFGNGIFTAPLSTRKKDLAFFNKPDANISSTEIKLKEVIEESRSFLAKKNRSSASSKVRHNSKDYPKTYINGVKEFDVKRDNMENNGGDLSNTFRKRYDQKVSYMSVAAEESKEVESPIFLYSETESRELMSSLTTEELFKNYTKNITMKELNENYTITKRSLITCLRYINFTELMQQLKINSKNNRITKENFITTISNMIIKINNVNSRLIQQRLKKVFNLIKGTEEELSLSEIAVGLVILCKGQPKDKISIALNYMECNNKITYKLIAKFLNEIFRVLLKENIVFVVNVNIVPEEFSKMTAIQCFDDLNKPYDSAITVNEFVDWFSSQVKTLVPKCKKLKTKYEISEGKGRFLERSKISPDLIKDSIDSDIIKHSIYSDTSSPFKLNSPELDTVFNKAHIKVSIDSHYPNPKDFERGLRSPMKLPESVSSSTQDDLHTMKKQWSHFLDHYYESYGFYPPPPLFQAPEKACESKSKQERNKKQILKTNSRHGRVRSDLIPTYYAV